MPNWCVNKLNITGNTKDIEALIKKVSGTDGNEEQRVLDFSKIVPPPDSKFYSINEGQNDFQCGCKKEFITTKFADGEPFTEGFVPHEGYWAVNGVAVEKMVLGNGTIKDEVGSAFGGVEVCPGHKVPQNSSHPDWWYNWNVANWGTKWNASGPHLERVKNTNITYHFDTAWAPPTEIVAALAEQYPTLSFEFSCCEAGMGFAGRLIYTGGKLLSDETYDMSDLPEEAWLTDEDGHRSYERDYDKVPATAFERFCEEEFGGVVGG